MKVLRLKMGQQPRERRSNVRNVVALAIACACLAAVTLFDWDETSTNGPSPSDARRAAIHGNEKVRRQAIEDLFKESLENIRALKAATELEGEDARHQAGLALAHLREELR